MPVLMLQKQTQSYWEKGFEIEDNFHLECSIDIEMYKTYLQNIVDLDGKAKYPFLSCMVKLLLSQLNGSSAPKSGFLITIIFFMFMVINLKIIP